VDKRTVIAFLICGALTFIWISRMQKRAKNTQPAGQPVATEQDALPETTTPASGTTAPDELVAGPDKQEAPEAEPGLADVPLDDAIPFGGPDLKYEATLSNRGACVREARLTEYLQKRDSDEGIAILKGMDDGEDCTLALIDPDGKLPLDTRNYEVTRSGDGNVCFTSVFEDGLRVTKEFIPRVDKYEMGVKVTFKNEGASARWTQYKIIAAGRFVPEGGSQVILKGLIGYGHDLGKISVENRPARPKRKFLFFKMGGLPYERTANDDEPISWVGASNRYFAAVLRPVVPEDQTTSGFVDKASLILLPNSDVVTSSSGRTNRVNNLIASLTTKRQELQPGEEMVHAYTYFMGPKKQDVLAQYSGLEQVLNYGMFGFVSKILLALLHMFHSIIPNYGVGIILVTILMKLCLHPLTRKSQLSMHKMQKLQPLIKEIQAKHKNDRQRQSKEQMELFRKHGANPMSGCLPMFLQLPVFFGLFRMLQYSVDIRHEPFISWITDLSRPDTIHHLGAFPINILPVLMVASWVGQQLTMPKPADPQQAQTQKMMLFMPIVFGFMLYGMASGLTLYWLTSTTIGIIEQRLIRRHIRKLDEKGELVKAEVVQPEQPKPRRARPRRR